jgi:hypothetical protein
MTESVYFVSVRWVETPIQPEMIDAALNIFGDWLRYTGDTWLVATDRRPEEIFNRVCVGLTQADSVLIIQTTPAIHHGRAPAWVWQWIIKHSGAMGPAYHSQRLS